MREHDSPARVFLRHLLNDNPELPKETQSTSPPTKEIHDDTTRLSSRNLPESKLKHPTYLPRAGRLLRVENAVMTEVQDLKTEHHPFRQTYNNRIIVTNHSLLSLHPTLETRKETSSKATRGHRNVFKAIKIPWHPI